MAAAAVLCATTASAQTPAKLKVGLMQPYASTFASLGTATENSLRQHVAAQGAKLSGREIEFVKVDDKSDPSKATDNVDVLTGSVHSSVAVDRVAKHTGAASRERSKKAATRSSRNSACGF